MDTGATHTESLIACPHIALPELKDRGFYGASAPETVKYLTAKDVISRMFFSEEEMTRQSKRFLTTSLLVEISNDAFFIHQPAMLRDSPGSLATLINKGWYDRTGALLLPREIFDPVIERSEPQNISRIPASQMRNLNTTLANFNANPGNYAEVLYAVGIDEKAGLFCSREPDYLDRSEIRFLHGSAEVRDFPARARMLEVELRYFQGARDYLELRINAMTSVLDQAAILGIRPEFEQRELKVKTDWNALTANLKQRTEYKRR